MIDLYMIRRFANMLFLINALTALLIIILSIFPSLSFGLSMVMVHSLDSS